MNHDPRLIDGQKLSFHPHRVAQWVDGRGEWERAKGIYPLYVEVAPVGACNHRCTFCAVDYIGYKAVTFDTDVLIARLREMGALGVRSVMFAGEGEPLLHKDIGHLVVEAKRAGLKVSFTTNGVLLQRLKVSLHMCSWVKVSVNAGTEETYRKIHKAKPGDWQKVWDNLAAAGAWKGGCEIGVQMVCLPENAGEEGAFAEMAERAGVDYAVLKPYSQHKSSITREYEGYKPLALPANGKRLVVRTEAMANEAHPYERCEATPYFWAYVMASGDVYSCSAYLLDERFRLGNLNESSFKAVWEGERRHANWKLMREELDIKECRVNCRMARVNEYLHGFQTVKNAAFI